MFRKNKVILFAAFYMLLCLPLPFLALYFFPKQASTLTILGSLFTLICLATFFSKLGRWRIGGMNAIPQQPAWKWILMLLLSEIGLIAIFLNSTQVLITGLVQSGQAFFLPLEHLQQLLLSSSLIRWGLFPWSMFAVITAHFAYISYHYNPYHAFSSHLCTHRHSFAFNILKRIIDICILVATRIFLILSLITLLIATCLLLFPTIKFFSLLYSLLIGSFLLLITTMKYTKDQLKAIEQKHFPQGLHYLIFFIIAIAVIAFLPFGISAISQNGQFPIELFMVPAQHSFLKPINLLAYGNLWTFFFWILAAPLFCSFITKFSYGRSVRAVMGLLLGLPLVLLVSYLLKHEFINIFYSSSVLKTMFGLAAVTLTYLFLQKDFHIYTALGFVPVKYPARQERLDPIVIWISLSSALAFLLLLHLAGALCVSTLAAPCCFFIYFALLFHRTKDS